MELLKTLGVNSTIWYQLGLLIVTFIILSQFIFRPYMKALEKRHQLTSGSESDAAQLLVEAQKIESQYEQRAKEINSEIRSYFDQARAAARKEQDQLISQARKDAEGILAQSREQLSKIVATTRSTLDREVTPLSLEISKRLLGKESL